MEESKKKKNYFLRVMLVLFILFLVSYIVAESGYYEASLHNDTMLTNQAMEKFEKDIIDGKDIDIENYISYESNEDYSNVFTDIGENLGNGIVTVLTDGTKEVGKILRMLFS